MFSLYGRHVRIKSGLSEFKNKTGWIVDKEGSGREAYYRIQLDTPVNVSLVGVVKDDLWQRDGFDLLRDKSMNTRQF